MFTCPYTKYFAPLCHCRRQPATSRETLQVACGNDKAAHTETHKQRKKLYFSKWFL